MKSILIMSVFALCLGALDAQAAPCNLQRCTASINGDAGSTSKQCTAPGGVDGCACTTASTGCSNVVIGTIPGGYHLLGYLGVGGTGICAGTGSGCILKNDKLINPETQEVIETPEEHLGEVFVENMEGRLNTYFGVVNTANRSTTLGRGNSAQAKLDACLYYSDVDWIETNGGSDNSEKHATCVGATYGCGNSGKNEYCNATGTNDGISVSAAVCKDRCDCLYTQGTCAGL